MTDIDLDDLERATRAVLAGEFKGAALWPAAIGLAGHTLALVARVRAAEAQRASDARYIETLTSNPHNPNAIALTVFKRCEEASEALGATSIGDLPVKARAAQARIAQLEAEVERLRIEASGDDW